MINWGIIGFGRMGFTFAQAIQETSNSKLIGIASKSGNTFKGFDNKSYEEIINDKKIVTIKKYRYMEASSGVLNLYFLFK